MRLSSELMNSGVLGRQKTSELTEWEYSPPGRPRMTDLSSPFSGFGRRSESIKVSPKGWRVLTNVLRFH